MNGTPSGRLDAELEQALADVGEQLRYPVTPELATGFRSHLERYPSPRRSARGLILRSTLLYPVLAAVVMVGSLLALSPGARSAVASWFHVVGVRIEFGGTPPGPLGRNLNLGRHVSLGEAQRGAAFPILVPAGLGTPDEVYAGTPPLQGSVSLIYHARPGMPRATATGAGLLITEYQSRYFLDVKLLPLGTTVAPVSIDGNQAVWLSGLPHVVHDLTPQGRLLPDTIRLAGNVLVWYHDKVTVRVEGQLSEGRMVEITQSMTATSHKYPRWLGGGIG